MLEKFITAAVYDTFKKQFDINITQVQSIEVKQKYYTSSIDIVFSNTKKTILIYSSRDLLANVANILLFEENPDEDCLIDLNNEIANLVVGQSKVLASNESYNYKIATPIFDGLSAVTDSTLVFESNMGYLMIGLNDGR